MKPIKIVLFLDYEYLVLLHLYDVSDGQIFFINTFFNILKIHNWGHL